MARPKKTDRAFQIMREARVTEVLALDLHNEPGGNADFVKAIRCHCEALALAFKTQREVDRLLREMPAEDRLELWKVMLEGMPMSSGKRYGQPYKAPVIAEKAHAEVLREQLEENGKTWNRPSPKKKHYLAKNFGGTAANAAVVDGAQPPAGDRGVNVGPSNVSIEELRAMASIAMEKALKSEQASQAACMQA
ncbi:hypothetical protein [Pararhizobium sp. O133]|uniref:hypothetical protein n=1 Tax=Pararhizobium sp. O133 TaxID=3449278 RepID=UPI003F687104